MRLLYFSRRTCILLMIFLVLKSSMVQAQFFQNFEEALRAEAENRVEDEVREFSNSRVRMTPMATTTTSTTESPPSPPPPADPFGTLGSEDLESSLDEKLDELDAESQELVVDYVRNGRKMNGDIRRRLVLYVMRFSPVQTTVEVSGDPRHIRKIEKIKYRFRTGMKLKYSSLKSVDDLENELRTLESTKIGEQNLERQKRIDRLVAHLLAPIFAPFMLLQPDEIRPLFASQQARLGLSQNQNQPLFMEPVTISPQQVSNQQSSFTALEMFPSSLPQDQWQQFDARWLSPQSVPAPRPAQFSVPSFTPFYQPFQVLRGA